MILQGETKCKKCGHKSHCDKECMDCPNDVCTGCECPKCENYMRTFS